LVPERLSVALPKPVFHQSVAFREVCKRLDIQEGTDIPVASIHPTLLGGPAWDAGVDGEAVVAGEVDDLGIEFQLQPTTAHHALEVFVAAGMRPPKFSRNAPSWPARKNSKVMWGRNARTGLLIPNRIVSSRLDGTTRFFYFFDGGSGWEVAETATGDASAARWKVHISKQQYHQSAWVAPFESS
jgi:hypothetical protein